VPITLVVNPFQRWIQTYPGLLCIALVAGGITVFFGFEGVFLGHTEMPLSKSSHPLYGSDARLAGLVWFAITGFIYWAFRRRVASLSSTK
jgi:hypothetical protein